MKKILVEIYLELIRNPRTPVFAESISPDSFAGKNVGAIADIELLEGNTRVKISDLFKVDVKGNISETPQDVNIMMKGDFSKFRYIGKSMTSGKITLEGNGGFYLGYEMRGGEINVTGDVNSWLGSMIVNGKIEVFGNAGDFVASPYRGMRKGMKDGIIIIHGNAGTEVARSMQGGLITITGNVGQFLGFDMQDGTIRVGGDSEGRVGLGMKGGRIIILGKIPEMIPSFTYTEIKNKVKFAKEKISESFYVYTGDTLENGTGKIFLSRINNKHLNPENEIFPEGISVNKLALPFVNKMLAEPEKLGLEVIKLQNGTTIIDAGVKAKGSEEAGILTALICVAGLSEFTIKNEKYGDIELPTLHQKTTGHPAAAMLGSQFAGWAIKTEDYSALGSGPARAISMQPKKLYQKLAYSDRSDVAILVVESDSIPTDSAVEYIAETSNVDPSNLYIIVASTSSMVGAVQTAGRIVETGIHKLSELGFMPNKILKGTGKTPISPIHPKSEVMMGMVNDMILYGGEVYYEVSCKSDDEIADIIDEAPSASSRDYGKPFYEIFVSFDRDFYKVDPGLFAPAKITIYNTKTGNTFTAGKISPEILKQSLALLEKV